MTAANKRKGASYEIDFVKWMREQGYEVDRVHLSGAKDEGDVIWRNGGMSWVFELKNVAQNNLTDFVRQASEEAGHYADARRIERPHFAVVIKKRNAPISESFVVVPLSEYVNQVATPF